MRKVRGENKLFTEQQRKQLESNPNVQHVTDRTITYTPSFKLAAIKAYQEGKTPMEIFLNAGFDIAAIGNEKPKKCLKRWREQYQKCTSVNRVDTKNRENYAADRYIRSHSLGVEYPIAEWIRFPL
ncbi:hypothetical protein P9H28_19125 [Paenibacillus barengoltzii]|nr:HTH domain-containing protein [Paenibacillus barengoltzii]MEC2346184.1 hypothetical protein [Paenibacillus barengoltzii]